MGNIERIKAIFGAGADVQVKLWPGSTCGYAWKIETDRAIKLKQLRELEEVIGHDAIDLVPATYEGDYSELTPGEGFSQGYVSFDWKEGP